MKVCKAAAVLTLAAMIGGCATPYSEAPLATNFPTTKQPKVQAAAHWNTIANDVAKQISASLADKQRPLFIARTSMKTSFDRGLSNQLLSALVALGHTVVKNPNDALSVEIDTQAIQFSANRPQYAHTGTATAITTGVWALHVGEAAAGAALYATVAAADAYSWFRSEFATGETPQTEIIVTTSVSDANQYLARNTSIYYVADADRSLYQETGLPMQPIKVKGGE